MSAGSTIWVDASYIAPSCSSKNRSIWRAFSCVLWLSERAFWDSEDSGGQIDTRKLEQHNSIMLKPRPCQPADANRICGLVRFSAHSLNFFVAAYVYLWFFANDMYYPSPNLDIQTRSTVLYLTFCQALLLVCKYHPRPGFFCIRVIC